MNEELKQRIREKKRYYVEYTLSANSESIKAFLTMNELLNLEFERIIMLVRL